MIPLWDIGNVLVDWNPAKILASLQGSDAHIAILQRELFDHPDWLNLDRGTVTEEAVTQRLTNECGLPADLVASGFRASRELLDPIDRTIELVRQIRTAGVPMYVLSNMSHSTWDHLNGRECFDWFEGIVISAQEQLVKPDPDIFHLVADRYSLNHADMVFIDDSEANIATAAQLGFKTVHFKRSEDCYTAIKQHVLS